ncbi:SGNH/GDSL hydrolase family protein [Lentisphaera marina]|uniref:SGNH/GDSL hydrolase family protein n=1 Tax=Lentisphaera marina TaxID=1111041 RepID=UPI002365CA32|nr:SGNH/GDSL hydrolase family protein [Lentisphaera marina]MDD7985381.1 SGNH/GDSL hydrolase family protein [Lentisphaera marina]
MKRSYKIIIFVFLIPFSLFSEVQNSPFHQKRIMFLGDSITRAGIYFRYIDYYLQKSFPDEKIDIIGLGLGSETTTGESETQHPWPRPNVHERLDRALELVKPDIVSVCYGMNDGLYHPFSQERFRDYQKGILALIEKVRASGAEVIVMTPPPFDPQSLNPRKTLKSEGADDFGFKTPYENYNDVLAKYGQWIMTLKIPGVTTIDIHTPIQKHVDEMRTKDPKYTISGDGIHPNALGHHLMARSFLKSLNLLNDDKSLAEAKEARKTDRLCALINKRTSQRANAWLQYVGYTRGTETVKTDSISDAEQEATLMQQEINKLKLSKD